MSILPPASRQSGLALWNCWEEPYPQWQPFWVLGFSAAVFVVWSIFENRTRGNIKTDKLASILNSYELGKPMSPGEIEETLRSDAIPPWEGMENLDYSSLGTPARLRWHSRPSTFELVAAVLLIGLMIWWW